MADSGVKKITIPKANLPATFGPTSSYIVRYRFVSDDKNRSSHWSPQHKISAEVISSKPYSMSVSSDKMIITLVWESMQNNYNYDIFVSWNDEDWQFLNNSASNSVVVLKPASAVSAKFAVQVPSFPLARYDASTIFVTNTIDLVV